MATPNAGSNDDLTSTRRQTKRPKYSKFTQQELPACKPILTPQAVISAFLIVTVVFVPIGVASLIASRDVVEIVDRYDSECVPLNWTNKVAYIQSGADKTCKRELHVHKRMKAPIYVYYQLDNFYQNHRRYVKSRNDEQLRKSGKSNSTSGCDPEETVNGLLIVPCGLIAWSMFNDTYSFSRNNNNVTVNKKDISWKSDREHKFGSEGQDGSMCNVKTDGLKRGLPITVSDYPMSEATGDSREIEEVAKEWEHTLMQNSMDRELHELNKRLEQKESEMKLFGVSDAEVLKQHFGRKIVELEDEKRAVQQERDDLLAEVENLAANSDGQPQKSEDIHAQKLKALEAQILDLKKKQESQVQLLKQKQKSDDAAKRLQDEIQSIKAQKVQLQQKIKQEAEQFRQWKASREKELLQLRKEGRRNEFERHKLQALNQRQKMVLQRKTEEAAMATKKLKELLEARKSSSRDTSVTMNGSGTNGQSNEKSLQRWLDHELEVMVKEHEVRFEYEKQSQVRAALAEELALLKQVNEFAANGLSPPRGKNGFARAFSMSLNARMARIASLENMLSISSNSLVAMASQLSEAEERERAFTNRGRWNQLRSLGEAKNLLQYMFNSVADNRCELWEKDMEIKEMKDQIRELVGLLRQSEIKRKEVEKELKVREQDNATTIAKPASGNSPNSLKHSAEDIKEPLSPESVPAQKQLKYTPGIANGQVRESAAFMDQNRRMVPIGQLSMKKLAIAGQASGKLWRWKRSHHQWLIQFKWKWQKPWRLSERIRHSDETIIRAKPRSQTLSRIM